MHALSGLPSARPARGSFPPRGPELRTAARLEALDKVMRTVHGDQARTERLLQMGALVFR